MSPYVGIVLWIVVGALIGWLSNSVVKSQRRSSAQMRRNNIVIALGGALVGGMLTRGYFGSSGDNRILANLLVAFVGSVTALGIVSLFRKPQTETQ